MGTDIRTDVRIDSPRFTGLRLLWFPPEPLPCSHNCYHYKILEQGKGTDDHLLPLSDWFFLGSGSGGNWRRRCPVK